jgi:hypothetical protein
MGVKCAILTGWCFKKHLFAGPPSTALGGGSWGSNGNGNGTPAPPRSSAPPGGILYSIPITMPIRRLRLGKLLYMGLSRSSNGYFKPLLDPGGGFTSEAAARRFHN